MNILKSVLFIVFVSVYQTSAMPMDGSCDGCVNYNFESNFEDLFTNEGCDGLSTWSEGTYSTVDVNRPFEYAETYISPGNDLSCVTSFPFPMTGGDIIQVKVYIHNSNPSFSEYFEVLAKEISATGHSPTLGFAVLTSKDTNFINGWQTLTFSLFGFKTTMGHLSFLANQKYNSTILVDSFCYKPAGYDRDCFAEYSTTTMQPEITTESETIPTTETETVTEINFTTSVVTNPAIVTETDFITSAVVEPTSESTITEEVPATEVTSTTALPTVVVPEPTLPTPAPGTNQCPVDPFIHWLLPHEDDCNLFYYCVWGEKVLRNCPAGLHFNPTIQVCDWPWSAGCTTN